MIIEIINEQEKLPFDNDTENLIKTAIETVAEETDILPGMEVYVTICDDESIREINKEYRNIDKSTDVLSFPMFSYSEPEVPNEEMLEGDNTLGDIIISLETATRQAEEYGHSVAREVSFLTVHSMLHLLGYDHIEEEDRVIMREREEYFLDKTGQRR